MLRDAALPLIDLRDVFQTNNHKYNQNSTLKRDGIDTEHIVVVGSDSARVGVIVDSLLGQQEIVIKSLSRQVGDVKGISGATILGDGRIALILDVNGLLSMVTERKVKAHAA